MTGPLLHGLALALGVRRRSGAPPASADAVAVLAVLAILSGVAASALATAAPRRFVAAGLEWIATAELLVLAVAWMAAREAEDRGSLGRLAALLFAIQPPLLALWLLARRIVEGAPNVRAAMGLALIAWGLVVVQRAIRSATDLDALRAACFTAALAALGTTAHAVLPARAAFTTAVPTPSGSAGTPQLDAEAVLHAQPDRLREALARLEPQRPGVADLYLIAFGADATQRVFLREVEAVQALFDRRFDTEGRSLVLANHRDGLPRHPIASGTHLRESLRHVGTLLDPEEDVLFLFLTGHGTRDPHRLAVHFPPLPLNRLAPEDLSAMVEEAGLGVHVVVVSACYAGGFVEPLAGPEAVVMTAAAADRTSFGCRNDAEWTEFGRAYFEEALPERFSFVAAFEDARARIERREREADRPASMPRLEGGEVALARLEALARRLAAAQDTRLAEGESLASPADSHPVP